MSAGGVTVSDAVWVAPPIATLIVTDVEAVTDPARIPKFAVVLPEAIRTEPSTLAAELLLVTFAVSPPDGAAAPRVMVPVEKEPLPIVVGLSASVKLVFGSTKRLASWLVLPKVAVILARTWLLTEAVVMANVADALPAETVTVVGTIVEASLLLSETVEPPVGA